MKFAKVILSLFVGVSLAIDWSKVISARAQQKPFYGISSRIVGGREAEPHEFPYQALLSPQVPTVDAMCGGSIISARSILTAAHCLVDARGELYNEIDVILGAHNRQIDESTQIFITTNLLYRHEEYDSLYLENE